MRRRRAELRISGIPQERLRRWRFLSRTESGSWPLPNLALVAVTLWLAPALVMESSFEQGGQTVRGSQVLLIQDRSGSMAEHQDVVEKRLAALRAAGIYSDVACELTDTEFPDFVQCVERIVRLSGADGIYVSADFHWQYHEDGLRRVKRALQEGTARMYLQTIGTAPHPELLRLATESGGAVIPGG